ncbi:hypothetical protein B0H13DRAFT_1853969 [Mycena leptocephala]|nr:hypothetical protein B0H13DRAFT_1853969 [Mycena leptocephala]
MDLSQERSTVVLVDNLFLGVGDSTDDFDGDGTAVSSVAAGLAVGVANKAQIIPIENHIGYPGSNTIKHYNTVWNKTPTSSISASKGQLWRISSRRPSRLGSTNSTKLSEMRKKMWYFSCHIRCHYDMTE